MNGTRARPGGRPLVICDCDGVIVEFVAPFRQYLDEQGYALNLRSFALAGNVVERASGRPLEQPEIPALVDGFFADRVEACLPVPGAVAAFAALRAHADVVILTNVPQAQRDRREAALRSHGIDAPVIANTGLKGEAVARLIEGHAHPAVFIDDLPPHHSAVAQAVGHVHRIHFVAETEVRPLLPPARDAHARIDEWPAALAHILGHIGV